MKFKLINFIVLFLSTNNSIHSLNLKRDLTPATVIQFEHLVNRLAAEGNQVESKEEIEAFIITHFDEYSQDKEYNALFSDLMSVISSNSIDLTNVETKDLLIDIVKRFNHLSQTALPAKEDLDLPNHYLNDFKIIYRSLCDERDDVLVPKKGFHEGARDTIFSFILKHFDELSKSDSKLKTQLDNFQNTLFGLNDNDFCSEFIQQKLINEFKLLDPNSK